MRLILAFGTVALLAAATYALNEHPDADGMAQSRPVTLAAVTPSDAPPHALACQEETAELRRVSAAPEADFLEEFFVVSDPRNLCRTSPADARGGYDPRRGRCYTLRAVGTGDPILPMSCSEVFSQHEEGVTISQIRCNGWNRRLTTTEDGDFLLAIGGSGSAVSRISRGSCKPI